MHLELWGGVECTINRIRDRYFNQIIKCGHNRRLDDFNRFASLGMQTLRHGILWEWVQTFGWDWADASLARMRELEMEPIVGLLHHGSGPLQTSLMDPQFPEKFAEYASQVARRYPWVSCYTPINEPLTTARFSGLYGHWYPHRRDDASFVTCLLNQVRGTVLAMQAIRRENAQARLVQTEDLGTTYSSEPLAYQAEFERLRRWITFDLLYGDVDKSHGLYSYLRYAGASEKQLAFFQEHRCPPDVVGINYYLTSDRYLDDAVENYPAHTVGGNGRQLYADVEAIRVPSCGLTGSERLLMDAWERYSRPVAITEIHNGAEIGDQIRWFAEVWHGAMRALQAGADVKAGTAWALLGSYDWNSLVTRENGRYECGPICAEGDDVAETELADVLRQAASGEALVHSALKLPGWWRTSARLIYDAQLDTVAA